MSTPPYYGRCYLANFNEIGYISHLATIHHENLHIGKHVFIGDRVTIYKDEEGDSVEIGDCVHLHQETYIQTGKGGSVRIGKDTHIQTRCQFSAYKASIIIGCNVEIAPGCAFYPYNHGIQPGRLISRQPLTSKGDIIVGDDVWIGFGVIILSGVKIGNGAVVAAGSIVTHDIPSDAVAMGAPARVVHTRHRLTENSNRKASGRPARYEHRQLPLMVDALKFYFQSASVQSGLTGVVFNRFGLIPRFCTVGKHWDDPCSSPELKKLRRSRDSTKNTMFNRLQIDILG